MGDHRRVQENWSELRTALGYDTDNQMWVELYKKHRGVKRLARALSVSEWTVRRALVENGVKIKKRGGGASARKVHFSQELYERIKREGLKATAVELDVAPYTLIINRRKWLRENPQA